MGSAVRLVILCAVLAAAAAPVSAASVDPPKRKSGLWEIKVSSPQMPGGHTIRQCVDQSTDDVMRKAQAERMTCSKNEMRRDGDKFVSDAVCQVEGTTVTTHTVFSGRFDSNYKADVKSTYNPPAHGMSESTSHIEGRWLGACLAGQKPGDVIMPGMPPGMPGNMQDMMKKGMKPGGE